MTGSIVLENHRISVGLDDRGGMLWMKHRECRREVHFDHNYLSANTDRGEFSTAAYSPEQVAHTDTRAEFRFRFKSMVFTLTYVLQNDRAYVERFLKLRSDKKITLYEVKSNTEYAERPEEVIDYHTFWNCPTVVFSRFHAFGVYSGFANPFFEVAESRKTVNIEFEPSLLLKPGEIYETDSNFWGIYLLHGQLVKQDIPRTSINYNHVHHTRYRNPSGYISLDRNEIASFKAFANDYLELRVSEFKLISYNYFNPLPQQPKTDEDEQIYYRYIDHFAEMGGDIMVFNPLIRQRTPLPDRDSYWEMAPEGSRAQRIIQYVKDKGLQYGIYMGSAPDNNHYCNSPMVGYASTAEKPLWKKQGIGGEISRENCIASDDFADWYFSVQKNTIEKYDITLWDWDPGPGNGFFCYSSEHGHIPGKGGYKGFRNAMEVIGRLKENFADLYIQGFHGTKEYGLWGAQYVDQHEAYWEQKPYSMSSLVPDISEDRLTAGGMRFQSWWSQNFRFMPSVTNHALAHKMTQSCLSPANLKYVFDHLGWKYAFMSALAVGGSMTVPVIPYDPSNIYGGYIDFFRKWIPWAKANFKYAIHSVAFGDQVRCGGVDGYARIMGGHGYIFLCNPASVRSAITFNLNDEIGLQTEGRYRLKQLYPHAGLDYYDDQHGQGIFQYGCPITVIVPPYEVLLFELVKHVDRGTPMLFNIPGEVSFHENIVKISRSRYSGDQAVIGAIHGNEMGDIEKLYVNGVEIGFKHAGEYLTFAVQYGDNSYPRYLYDWKNQHGEYVNCPNGDESGGVTLTTEFYASSKLKAILESAKPKTADTEARLIAQLQAETGSHNFVWAQPHRLFLIVPFVDANQVGDVKLSIDGTPCEPACLTIPYEGYDTKVVYYVDITDIVRWEDHHRIQLEISSLPMNQFLGAYLYYPPAPPTDEVAAVSDECHWPVISEKLYPVRELKPWYSSDDIRVMVNSAWISEGVMEEFRSCTVCASVNLDPALLEGVYMSAQISIDGEANRTLLSDQKMVYDQAHKVWKRTVRMGSRELLIVDGPYLYVWAVTADGYVSPAYKVKVEWRLP